MSLQLRFVWLLLFFLTVPQVVIAEPLASNIQQRLATGYGHSLFIDDEGWVWGWGSGLSLDGLKDWRRPTRIMPEAQAVAAGLLTSFVLKKDGTLWGWGTADSFVLGGDRSQSTGNGVPLMVMSEVVAVAAASDAALVIKKDNSLWVWGKGLHVSGIVAGKRNKPKQIMKGVAQAVISDDHILALKLDGTLWAWGDNYCGELGVGTSLFRTATPQLIKIKDKKIASITAANARSMALTKDGKVYYWGDAVLQRFKDQCYECIRSPKLIQGAEDIRQVAFNSTDRDLFLYRDGVLSIGGQSVLDFNPEELLNNVVTVAGGENHILMLRADGTLWAYGVNRSGQLGNGTEKTEYKPEQVIFPKDSYLPLNQVKR